VSSGEVSSGEVSTMVSGVESLGGPAAPASVSRRGGTVEGMASATTSSTSRTTSSPPPRVTRPATASPPPARRATTMKIVRSERPSSRADRPERRGEVGRSFT
jgi:hypothetical protein